MNKLHRIRLQGPWQVAAPGLDPKSPLTTVQLPAAWRTLFGETGGLAVFQRAFNTPTNLDAQSRILIRLPENCGEPELLLLNGQHVPALEESRFGFDITQPLNRMNFRNLLEIHLEFHPDRNPDAPGGIWEPVVLEIDEGS